MFSIKWIIVSFYFEIDAASTIDIDNAASPMLLMIGCRLHQQVIVVKKSDEQQSTTVLIASGQWLGKQIL